jgi:transposase
MTTGEKIIQAIKDGKTQGEIAKEIGLAYCTINRFIKQIRDSGIKLDIKRGRPYKIKYDR